MFVENTIMNEMCDPYHPGSNVILSGSFLQTCDASGISILMQYFHIEPNPEDLYVCRKSCHVRNVRPR